MPHPEWPFFDLRITTPRLQLRYPNDEDAAEAMRVAGLGVHPPEYMPFNIPWTRIESPEFERKGMQYYWRARADLTAEQWAIPFVCVVDGEIVGTQSAEAKDFAVTRTASTGSWVAMARQGQGIGKEMRTAILHFLFEGLQATTARSAAFEDNAASTAVSTALGYERDGTEVFNREGKPATQVRFKLDRSRWQPRDDIAIAGLESCLPVLGLG